MKSKWPEFIAYILLIAGMGILILAIVDFNSDVIGIEIDDKSANLGTLLSGTVGLFFSGAGILLFFAALRYQRHDLELQRQELSDTRTVLREQSQTIKLQTYESTFFRLIDNHITLVGSLMYPSGNGTQGINGYYQTARGQIEQYKNASISGMINILDHVHYSPIERVEHYKDNLSLLAKNVAHIIKLVHNKLEDNLFYHETFYYTLTNSEKYFLGLYSYCGNREYLEILKTSKLNYLDFYEQSESSFFDPTITEIVPYVNIISKHWSSSNVNHNSIIESIKSNQIFVFMCEIKRSSNQDLMSLKKVTLISSDYQHMLSFVDVSIPTTEKLEIDLIDLFKDTIVKNFTDSLKSPNNHGQYSFYLNFEFEFNKRRLHYKKGFRLSITKNGNMESLWSISNLN